MAGTDGHEEAVSPALINSSPSDSPGVLQSVIAVEEGRPTRAASRGAGVSRCACTGCQMDIAKQGGKCRPKKADSGKVKSVSKVAASLRRVELLSIGTASVDKVLETANSRKSVTPEGAAEQGDHQHDELLNELATLPSAALENLTGDSEREGVPSVDVPGDDTSRGTKSTRQWAAWTHQEEVCFFNALRAVGKNFEVITARVGGKNKDQVRHYYYRTVKRLRKLVGPGFRLDPSNSKEANAAMLRWWALLEKHGCTAADLRKSPKRLRKLVNLLEHQLLADQRKASKKLAQEKPDAASNPGSPVQKMDVSCGTGEGSSWDHGRRSASLGASSSKAASDAAEPDPQALKKNGKPAKRLKAKVSSTRSRGKTVIGRASWLNCEKLVDVGAFPGKRKAVQRKKPSAEEMKSWEVAANDAMALMAAAAAQLEETAEMQPQAPGTPRAIDQGSAVFAVDTAENEFRAEDHVDQPEDGAGNCSDSPAPREGITNVDDMDTEDKPNLDCSVCGDCLANKRLVNAKSSSSSSDAKENGDAAEANKDLDTSASRSSAAEGTIRKYADACTPVSGNGQEVILTVAPENFQERLNMQFIDRINSVRTSADLESLAPVPALLQAAPPPLAVNMHVGTPAQAAGLTQDSHRWVNGIQSKDIVLVQDPLRQGMQGQVLESSPSKAGKAEQAGNHTEKSARGMSASKLKLQLFPEDDSTRLTLQKEGHNPHLELTVKGSKSASAIVQHLTVKWQSSQAARGELRLMPYQASGTMSWGLESAHVTVEDMRAMAGALDVFRLRYVWRPHGTNMCFAQPTTAPLTTSSPLPHPLNRGPSLHTHLRDLPFQCSAEGERRGDTGGGAEPGTLPGFWNGVSGEGCFPNSRVETGSLASARRLSSGSFPSGRMEDFARLRGENSSHAPEDLYMPNARNAHAGPYREMVVGMANASLVQTSHAPLPTPNVFSHDCPTWVYEESRDGFGRQNWTDQNLDRSHLLLSNGRTRSNSVGLGASDKAWVDSVTNVSLSEFFQDAAHAPGPLLTQSTSSAMQLWGLEDTRDAFESARSGAQMGSMRIGEAPAFGTSSAIDEPLHTRLAHLPETAGTPAPDCIRQEAQTTVEGERGWGAEDRPGFSIGMEQLPDRAPRLADPLREEGSLDAYWTSSLGSIGIALPQPITTSDLDFGGEGSASLRGLIAGFRTPNTEGVPTVLAAPDVVLGPSRSCFDGPAERGATDGVETEG